MEWDLGPTGIAVLVGMSLAFGAVSQVLAGRGITRWMWLVAAGTFFVAGLIISEAWFGRAREEDLQPNYDGLSFDETLLATVPGIAVVIVVRQAILRRRAAQATAAPHGAPPRPTTSDPTEP